MKTRFNTVPFNPARWPFFYGWMVLLWGIGGTLLSAPGQTTGVAAFTEPLLDALHLSRLQLSIAYMIGTLCSAAVLTPAGKLYDRIGSRWMAGGACFLLGCVLILLSAADRIGGRVVQLIPGPTGLIVTMSLLFFLLRFSGQGLLTLSSRNMTMKWFERHRGLASGLTGVAVGYGFAKTPELFHGLIEQAGWSSVWRHMGLIWIGVCTPLILLLFRDNPEDCGLIPDGAPAPVPEGETGPPKPLRSLTLAEARRTYVFWVFGFALALQALAITAITFHIESIFTEAGLPGSRGFSVLPAAALISIAVTLLGGWLSDHLALRRFYKLFLLSMAVSAFCLMELRETLIPLLIVSLGITGGLFGLLLTITWPKYFGREHLGAISGLNMSMQVVGSAVGPMLWSMALKFSGSYRVAQMFCLIASLVLFAAAFRAVPPRRVRDDSA